VKAVSNCSIVMVLKNWLILGAVSFVGGAIIELLMIKSGYYKKMTEDLEFRERKAKFMAQLKEFHENQLKLSEYGGEKKTKIKLKREGRLNKVRFINLSRMKWTPYKSEECVLA